MEDLRTAHLCRADELHGISHLANVIDTLHSLFDSVEILHQLFTVIPPDRTLYVRQGN